MLARGGHESIGEAGRLRESIAQGALQDQISRGIEVHQMADTDV
jgi:hypothetical protein